MHAETIRFRIVGTKRLLMSSSRLADPLDPVAKDLARLTSKRRKTESDHKEISRVEWNGCLWLHAGKPCIPAQALSATFVAAAKSRRRGKDAAAGLVVDENALLRYDGPENLDELWEDTRFRLRVGVKVKTARTMRTRPCFADWSFDFAARFLPTLLNRDEVIETFTLAGFTQGLGDWRPQNGTFAVEVLD